MSDVQTANDGLKRVDRRGRQAFAAGVGNVVEWYDWYAYSFLAVFFSKQVFDSSSDAAGLLSAFAVFAASFLLRPIGGLLIGNLADRIGRKNTLALTIITMGLGSLIVGLTPTYASVGFWAPVVLVLGRLISGLSVGGEFAANTVFLVESAPEGRRGFFSSLQYVSTTIGQLLATGITSLLLLYLHVDGMEAWGWRVPFIFGAVLSVIGLWVRRTTEETLDTAVPGPKPKVFDAVVKYPKATFLVIGVTIAGTVLYYTWTTYISTYIQAGQVLSKESALLITMLALVAFLIVQPFAGMLSDKIGRRPVLIVSMGAFAVGIIPGLYAVSHWGFVGTLLVVILGMLLLSLFTSVSAAVNAEIVPTHVRSAGIGFPYSVAVALFGGTAPFLATWFATFPVPNIFGFWVIFCCVISLLVVIFGLKETAFKPLPN